MQIEVHNDGRHLTYDSTTDEWVLEQDGQVLRSRDKREIEDALDRLDMMEC